MPICPWGAEPKPDAPSTVTFDAPWILDILQLSPWRPVSIAAQVAEVLITLLAPTYDTAEFVSVDPPSEMPTIEDWAKLAFPPAAALTGTYRRFSNLLLREKWLEVAQCKPFVVHPTASPGLPDDWVYLAQAQCVPSVYSQPNHPIMWSFGPLPKSIFAIYLRRQGDAAWPISPNNMYYSTVPIVPGTPATNPGLNAAGLRQTNPWGSNGYWYGIAPPPTASPWTEQTDWYLGIESDLGDGTYGSQWCFDVAYDPKHLPATNPDVDPFVPPVGCPDVTDPAAFSAWLCELDRKVDQTLSIAIWLMENAIPPAMDPDESALPLTANQPLVKPADALGAIVHLNAPAWMSGRAGSHGVRWGMGWYAFGYGDAWMPSVQLKHVPQVIWPIPSHVSQLSFDLTEGVTGTIRWLRAVG
jgi:hypothetical protein